MIVVGVVGWLLLIAVCLWAANSLSPGPPVRNDPDLWSRP